jgi:hypothetical protein
MLGGAIGTRPLAREGLAQLTSAFGRTRLAETPVPAWGRAEAGRADKDGVARAASAGAAVVMRP